MTRSLLGIVVFAIGLLWLQSAHAQQEQFKFKHIDLNDGLSHPEVRAIIKDTKGFVWLGTAFGLNRFDGYTVKSFFHDPQDTTSLAADGIDKLFEAPDGRLIVQTYTGLNVYNPDNENFDRRPDAFLAKYRATKELFNIIRDRDSAFWFVEPHQLIKYDPKDGSSTVVQHVEGDSSSVVKENITDFAIDAHGSCWTIHENGIVEKIQIENGHARVIQRVLDVYRLNKSTASYHLACDSDGDLWIHGLAANQGVFYYNLRQNRLEHITTTSQPLRLNTLFVAAVVVAPNGAIWISTDHGGINIVDKKNLTVRYVRHREGDATSLAANTTTCIYRDDQGIMWIGSYKKGVSYYHENIYRFSLYKHYALDPGSLPFEDVNEFAEDSKGNLWIGTNGGGLLCFDRRTGKFTQYLNDPKNENSLSADVIVALCVDHEQNLWIGTYRGGLNKFDGKKFTRYKHVEGDSLSLPSNNIWDIFEDSRNRIWIGTIETSAAWFDKTAGKFHRLKLWGTNGMQSVTIDAIGEDRNGNIWFGTPFGLDVLSNDGRKFTHYASSAAPNSLSHNNVLDILRDSKGRLWIATFDGVNLFDEANNGFKVFRQKRMHNTTFALEEDSYGHIWMSTLDGLWEMSLDASERKASFKRYTESDGIQGRQFNQNAGFKTREGELIFGGPSGFNIVNGKEQIVDLPISKIIFSDLELYEEPVAIGNTISGVVILNKSISEATELTFPPDKNFFSIKFSALNYINPERDTYMYKVEGLNTGWLPVDSRHHEIVFNSLNPGRYTLRVKAANRDGVWSEPGAKLIIIVKPPFWKTKTAFALYSILLLAAFIAARKMIQQREKIKFTLEQERREVRRVHELDMLKVRLFTNVSHEFRTPLTLILTPIERLLKKVTDPDLIAQFQLIQRNGKRLMKLVNQLLDFKKLEVQEIKLNLSKGDVVNFTKDAVMSFSDLSEKKNVALEFNSSLEHLETLFDQDKLEKILFNLLSNAFKFTLDDGVVSVRVELTTKDADRFIRIDVKDTGIGIAEDKVDKIFEPFFQTDVPKSIINVGSGIGLAITKEFVRIHGGHISVDSKVGKGSCFTVLIPFIEPVVSNEQGYTDEEHDEEGQHDVVASIDRSNKVPGKSKKKSLLLVEDSDDFRFYLKDNLKFLYTIHEAKNGLEGWNKTLELQPDLIVSDIMMPEIDGIELCMRIKSDERVSHIPVILLTARSSEEQRLEGFKAGADDYMTKPFNFEVLEARIGNLLQRLEKSQMSFRKTLEVKSSELQITPLDVKFIDNAVKCVEANISNADFSVEDMASELAISRAYVFKKILALTGKTPLEFMRTIRLQHAAQLLEKSQLSVREISYRVGYNGPRYFTKHFKEHFNVLPSDYLTSKTKNDESV